MHLLRTNVKRGSSPSLDAGDGSQGGQGRAKMQSVAVPVGKVRRAISRAAEATLKAWYDSTSRPGAMGITFVTRNSFPISTHIKIFLYLDKIDFPRRRTHKVDLIQYPINIPSLKPILH